MPGPPRGPSVTDDHHVARLDRAAENSFDGRVLALEDARFARKSRVEGSTPAVFHDGAVDGEVAVQNGKAAVPGEGVLHVANNPPVSRWPIDGVVAPDLAEGNLGGHSARCRLGRDHDLARAAGTLAKDVTLRALGPTGGDIVLGRRFCCLPVGATGSSDDVRWRRFLGGRRRVRLRQAPLAGRPQAERPRPRLAAEGCHRWWALSDGRRCLFLIR